MIAWIYLVFAAAAPVLTARLAVGKAVWLTYFLGLVALPPAIYGDVSHADTFDWRVIGNALPSDLRGAAPLVAAFGALLVALVRDSKTILSFRPRWIDAPMVGLCLWPMVQDALVGGARPSGALAALWIACVCGIPWLLGRIFAADDAGRFAFLDMLAVASLALMPFAYVESISLWRFHEFAVGPHPFAFDGAQRYLGYRPLLFFENGNQYGLFVCIAAFLTVGGFTVRPASSRGPFQIVAGVALCVAAVASQSIGALALAVAGGVWLAMRPRGSALRSWGAMLIAVPAALGVAYILGLLPLRRIAEAIGVAEPLRSILHAVGRQSLAWRASQNDATGALLVDALPLGSAQWDWFAAAGTRPWGFWSLAAGQYGLPFLALLVGALAMALRRFGAVPGGRPGAVTDGTRRLFQIGICLVVIDAVLNSFLFYPMSAMMGACAAAGVSQRTALPRQPRLVQPVRDF